MVLLVGFACREGLVEICYNLGKDNHNDECFGDGRSERGTARLASVMT